VGEAYLMVDNLPKAEEHLAALRTICLVPCEELDDLRKKIDEYRQKRQRVTRGVPPNSRFGIRPPVGLLT
jgi:hypothetical protein